MDTNKVLVSLDPVASALPRSNPGNWDVTCSPLAKRVKVELLTHTSGAIAQYAPVAVAAQVLRSNGSREQQDDTDTDDEQAAALLLGMGTSPQSPAALAAPFESSSIPRKKRTACNRARCGDAQGSSETHLPAVSDADPARSCGASPASPATGITNTSAGMVPAGKPATPLSLTSPALLCTQALLSDYLCGQCLQPVSLSNDRRPAFLCIGACKARGGSGKRLAKAVLAADTSVQVSALQVAQSLGASVSKEDSDQSKQSADGSVAVEQLRVPSISAGESQGRCKCGKRITADHPPCKSELMLLCEKFQRRFGRPNADGQAAEIMLKDAATELGVSRRRLYDIINVLEAVEVVRRTGKLTYEWRGLEHLSSLLQRMVLDEEAGTPVEERAKRTPAVQGAPDMPSMKEDARTQHTLWALSRKFVRILLTRTGPLPLADVAQLLMADSVTESRKSQTQITIERRLYDIGSILTAVGLIQKTYLGKRQPAFMWTWSPKDAPLVHRAPPQVPTVPSALPATGLELPKHLPTPPPFSTTLPGTPLMFPGVPGPASLGMVETQGAPSTTWPLFWPAVPFNHQPQLFVGGQGPRVAVQGHDCSVPSFPQHLQMLLPPAFMMPPQGGPGGPSPGLWQSGMLAPGMLNQQLYHGVAPESKA